MRTSVPWRRAVPAIPALAALLSASLSVGAIPAFAQGYGGGGTTSSPTPTPAATPSASPMASGPSAPMQITLTVRTTSTFGTFLAGPNGRTLYTLSSDPTNGSICTGQCLTFWPPLQVARGGSASVAGASVALGSFVRADTGATQVSVAGRALYNFQGDSAPGQTNGEGIKALGGVWHVATLANVTRSTGSSASPRAATGSALPLTDAAPSPESGQPSVPLLLLLVAMLAFGTSFAFVSRQSRRH